MFLISDIGNCDPTSSISSVATILSCGVSLIDSLYKAKKSKVFRDNLGRYIYSKIKGKNDNATISIFMYYETYIYHKRFLSNKWKTDKIAVRYMY